MVLKRDPRDDKVRYVDSFVKREDHKSFVEIQIGSDEIRRCGIKCHATRPQPVSPRYLNYVVSSSVPHCTGREGEKSVPSTGSNVSVILDGIEIISIQ